MSNKFISAFHFILNNQGRSVILERNKTTTATIIAAPSNYFRNFKAMEEIQVEGREYVVSKKSLDDSSFGEPRRGDTLVDEGFGIYAVQEVREMVLFGNIVGYRLRVG